MATKARSIAIREFESKCMSLVDEVAASGEPVILTKAGEPIAKIVPIHKKARPLLGSVLWEGDIVSPLDESWDADS
jgi:prevent-host-death family protein